MIILSYTLLQHLTSCIMYNGFGSKNFPFELYEGISTEL